MSFLSQLTEEAKKKIAFIESLVSHPSAPVQAPQNINISNDQLNANINRNQGAISQLAQNPVVSQPPVGGVSQPSFMQRVSNGLNNINLSQRTPAPSVLDNYHPIQDIQYGFKNPMDVLNQVPQATGQVLGGVSNTFAPSMTKFFTNAGDVIGEGAQLGMNTIQKSLNTPGNTVNVPEFNAQNYPALFKNNPVDMAKQTVGAGLEATVLKYIPETAKMGIIARGGVGALQGMGFSLANGISQNKTWDDIKKDMTSNGIAASVIMMAEPYLKPLLTGQGIGTQLSSDVSGIKDEFGNIKSDINQLRNPLPQQNIVPNQQFETNPNAFSGGQPSMRQVPTEGATIQQGGNMPFSPQSDFFKTLQKGSNVPVGMSIKDVSGESPLIQEARKYKSAEEFVDRKTNQLWDELSKTEKRQKELNSINLLDESKARRIKISAELDNLSKRTDKLNRDLGDENKLKDIWNQANTSLNSSSREFGKTSTGSNPRVATLSVKSQPLQEGVDMTWARGTRAGGIQNAGAKNYNQATKVLEKAGELPSEIKTPTVTKDFIKNYYETKKPPVVGDAFINAKGEKIEITKVEDGKIRYFLKGKNKGIEGIIYTDKPFFKGSPLQEGAPLIQEARNKFTPEGTPAKFFGKQEYAKELASKRGVIVEDNDPILKRFNFDGSNQANETLRALKHYNNDVRKEMPEGDILDRIENSYGKVIRYNVEDVTKAKKEFLVESKSQPLQEGVSQGITPNVSLEKSQPTVAGQETGVPLENQPPGQQVPDMTGNKLPPSDVSYNQDVAPNGDNVKQRGFLETLQNSDKATPEMKQAASELPQGYTPIPQKLSEANAQKFVDEVGVDKAHQSFIDNTPWSSDKTKVGDVLLNKYAESGDMSKFKEIASSYDDQARQAGQGNAAINGWSQMSPKAVLNVVDDAANKLGKPISDDFRTQLVNRAADIQKMAKNSPERLQATQTLLQDIAKELPNSFMENFKAYRFQNMLSNPVTIGKIGYSGLFNTMVTHPVDMIAEATTQGAKRLMNSDYQRTVYYSNIPKWYKDVFIGIPDAWDAAVQGFKKGTIDKALSDGVSGETAVQMARNQNTSKYLSFFPKLHSFVYNYGQSIISGAEFARMMDNGATEVEAKATASKLADKLTLRSKLGANDQAAIVRAVDSMGNMISRSADKPGIGWMQSWVAPFMKVSTNWTKLAVEHSPLALPDTAFNMLKGKAGAENAFAHAMVGSMVTGIGVSMSMKDNVTLAAPTDKTQSDLFYASGKKPYSVKVGNSWVPMQYFGPFGLSLMLPQAMKEALTGVNAPKDTFTKSEQAVSKVTKMIISTTPLPTISQFIDILNGTSGVNPATVAAGLAGQVMPLDAMQRYISGIVDPIYRKASSFTDRIESGIPGMSKNLPAYTTPTGQPETRNASNYIAPYGIGKQDNQYEPAYKNRQQVLNSNAIVNQANKDAQNGTIQNPNGGKQIADKIWQLPDNTFTYQLSDGSYAKAKTQDEAKLGQAKDTLLNTDDQQYAASGNKVLVKNDDGTVKTITSKVSIDPNDKTSLALIGSGHGALTQDYPTDDTPQSNQLKRQQVSQLQSLYLDDKVSDDDKNAAYQKLGLTVQDVDKMMQMKDDGVAISPTMVEAYKFDQQASQLPKDQANQMVNQLFTQDPKAYQMVKKIREYNTTGISTSDITTYNITNGERAKYIDSILSKRDPQEANTILGMLYKQGIVTKTVLKQLRQIRNAK